MFVGGRVDGGGNIIRCRRRIIDQAGIYICLVHGRKARDTDEVAKNQHHHVHWENNAKSLLRLFQKLLLEESSSLWCQGGCMWDGDNGGVDRVQRPGRSYIGGSA